MIAWVALAVADPGAVRAPSAEAFAVEVGAPGVSIAAFRGDQGIGVWMRTDLGSAGAVLAFRRQPSGFGWTAHASTGLVVTLVRPGLGVHTSLAGGLGHTGDRAGHRLEVVVPVTVGQGAIRAPVMLEGSSMVRIGGWRVGGRGAAGAILGGGRPALTLQGGLVVGR